MNSLPACARQYAGPDELLVCVRWPVAKAGTAYGYYKLGLRQADAISVVSIAIRLEADASGCCQDARIALGSVAPRPLRAMAAEESLRARPSRKPYLPEQLSWQPRRYLRSQICALREITGGEWWGFWCSDCLCRQQMNSGKQGNPMESKIINLIVNGRKHKVVLEPNITLLHALREHLGYVDVKNGCEKGDCGACTVLLDGKAVNSCLVLAWQADGCEVITNAGLGNLEHPHVIQEAFADVGAAQCGYCTPAW